MKSIASCFVILGMLALIGCSGDSPSADPVPTVVPDAWGIDLTVPSPVTYTGNVISLMASVTMNGNTAPDGTLVVFEYSSNGIAYTELAQVQTEGGNAATGITSTAAGSLYVRARANTASDVETVTWQDPDASDGLEIFTVAPEQGAWDGGEQVTMTGKGILAPVEVIFVADGAEAAAEVVSVIDSVPLDAEGTIIIRSPRFDGVDRTLAIDANIDVTSGVVTAYEDSYTVEAGFTYQAEQVLQIIQPLDPNYGVYDGNDTVTLRGRGIRGPVRVTFDLNGTNYPAVVQSVTDSNPVTAEGQIIITTPYIPVPQRPLSENGILIAGPVTVFVEVGVDQTTILSESLPGAFTYVPSGDEGPQVWRLDEPYIYLVVPDHGVSAGGETVTILGRNFRAKKYDSVGTTVIDTEPAIESVLFGTLQAQVVSVSTDGTQAQVITPRFSAVPLTSDQLVSVTVNTQYPTSYTPPDKLPPIDLGPYSVTLTNSFVVLADEPTPEITAIAPIAGPLDGGTVVTIFGHGFQFPVQVTFGDLEAENVNVTDDQTQADQDIITCEAPDYAQQGEVPPVAVEVKVLNALTGKESNTATYTYGDNLYVTGNTPSEGRRGDLVIIYGSGFEDPLQVTFSDLQLEVVSVSGTELVVKFPDAAEVTCSDNTGSFTVTLLERDTGTALGTAEGGSYTYKGNSPHIYNVDPIFVNVGDDLLITGDSFAEDVQVTVNGVFWNQDDVTRVDDTLIEAENVPSWDALAIEFDEQPCFDQDLGVGVEWAPTAVDVAVLNFPGECIDVLANAIVFQVPVGDPNLIEGCRFPEMVVTDGFGAVMNSGDTLTFGVIDTTQVTVGTFNIANINGEADLIWTVAFISGDTDVFSVVTDSGTTAPGLTDPISIEAAPSADGDYSAVLEIVHNDTDLPVVNPFSLLVTATAVTPPKGSETMGRQVQLTFTTR